MAVELSKLSQWLAIMDLGKPLSFLDHHLVWGNSLVSTSMREISELVFANDLRVDAKSGKKPDGSHRMSLGEIMETEDPIQKASRLLEEIRSKVVETAGDVKVQEVDYELFKEILGPYRLIGDLIAARKFGWRLNQPARKRLCAQRGAAIDRQ